MHKLLPNEARQQSQGRPLLILGIDKFICDLITVLEMSVASGKETQ